MRSRILPTFVFCLILLINGTSQISLDDFKSAFRPLVDRTWVASGNLGNGTVYKQEVTFEFDLGQNIVIANSMGFVDEKQTEWGRRNHGVRQWSPDGIRFSEFDVLGGMTNGEVMIKGSNIFYQYTYDTPSGEMTLTDAWEKSSANEYQFTVGEFENGEWKQKFLETSFKAMPKFEGDRKELDHILKNVAAFSQAYIDGNYRAMAEAYTADGKIFPNGALIIEGHHEIEKRWVLPEGQKILMHKVSPVEIVIIDDIAYDHGYYEGKTQLKDGNTSEWKGKYVIVWKKVNGNWKMYLDIWNRVNG